MTTAEANLLDQSRGASRLIYLVGFALLMFLGWASFAWINEIVRAEGEVVSSSRAQIVQNLEGGILAELHVGQGDGVEQGQVLAKLSDTKFRAKVDDLQDQIDALEIRRHRLEAELAGAFDFAVPDDLAKRSPGILASERALLAARQNDFTSRRDGARDILDQLKAEHANFNRLYNEEIVSLLEVNNAKKAMTDARINYTNGGMI